MKSKFLIIALLICSLFAVFGELHSQEMRVLRREALVLAEPVTGAVVLDVLSAGVNVEVAGREGQWIMVRIPGSAEVGWVESSFLGAESVSPAAAVRGRDAAPVGLTDAQVSVLRNRVSVMGGGLDRLEAGLDRLMDRLQDPSETAPRQEQQLTPPQRPETLPDRLTEQYNVQGPPRFLWTNRFVMGKYFRGGEDLYGLGFSRGLDRWGLTVLELETVYGMGDERGQADDFIEWGLGFRFNVKRRSYWIYPFFESAFGMRHRVGDVPDGSGPLRYKVWFAGGGVKAELSDIFSLEAGSRAIFLYGDTDRRDEGRISFSVAFSY